MSMYKQISCRENLAIIMHGKIDLFWNIFIGSHNAGLGKMNNAPTARGMNIVVMWQITMKLISTMPSGYEFEFKMMILCKFTD